ncbi:MAG: TetR/AcrR family transcriptional regulator [Acidimicrobiia bacterium]
MSETATVPTPPTRRERLRQELTRQIKDTALAQLAQGGPGAVGLRAIAREIGVSPTALYGYFASLDDLFTALIADGFHDLADTVGAAADRRKDDPVQDRMLAMLFAYRQWALEHDAWFRLLYFSPVPGYVAPEDGPTLDATLRVSATFLFTMTEAWAQGVLPQPEPGFPLDCSKFHDIFGLPITPDQMRVAVGCWGEFHGMVSLEVNGHIHDDWVETDDLFAVTMRSMMHTAGFPEPSPEVTPAAVRAEIRAARTAD